MIYTVLKAEINYLLCRDGKMIGKFYRKEDAEFACNAFQLREDVSEAKKNMYEEIQKEIGRDNEAPPVKGSVADLLANGVIGSIKDTVDIGVIRYDIPAEATRDDDALQAYLTKEMSGMRIDCSTGAVEITDQPEPEVVDKVMSEVKGSKELYQSIHDVKWDISVPDALKDFFAAKQRVMADTGYIPQGTVMMQDTNGNIVPCEVADPQPDTVVEEKKINFREFL